MTRLSALVWFVLVLAAGFATFKVKYAVQDIEDQLARVRKQTVAEQQEVRVLNAEWTYLSQPERLAELNQRFLGLQPIAARQLQHSIADIPLRPASPPAPDALVAAKPGAAAPTAAGDLPVTSATTAAITSAPPGAAPAGAALPVRLATAGRSAAPASLDALIARIAETR